MIDFTCSVDNPFNKKGWKVHYPLEAALGDGCSNLCTKAPGDWSLMANLLHNLS